MLLKVTQLNGEAQQPLQWGKIHIMKQLLAFVLYKAREKPRGAKIQSNKKIIG